MSDESTVENKRQPNGLLYAMAVVIMLMVGIGIIVSSQMDNLDVGFKSKHSKIKMALVPRDHAHSHNTQKISSPFDITLQSETGLEPVEPGQPFRLEASVSASTLMSNVNIEWVIPEGVEVMSGTEEYTVSEIGPEAKHTSEIILKSPDYTNYKIHFSANAGNDEATYSLVKQYNTQEQSQIEADAKALHEKHKKFVEKKMENGESARKPIY